MEIPYGTTHLPHVRLCGQFTTHTVRVVKKIEKKKCPFSSLFHPFARHSSPRSKLFFFYKKKSRVFKKYRETQEMSSPGTVKVTRHVSPWSKDYHTSVTELETNDLLRSTLTDESHTEKSNKTTCLFCGFSYFWSPIHFREHLGITETSKQVQ